MKKQLLFLTAFLVTLYGAYAQCGSGEDTEAPVVVAVGDGTLGNPFVNLLQTTVANVPSGTYYFNFNGNTFQGVLDNDTDGGGWLMVLNYVHLAGDDSVLQVRNADLPLLGSSTLGDNEAATANWGHMGNQLAAAIDFEEMRFYGRTTGHTRIIDFKTSFSNAVNYVKTGTGSFDNINNGINFTPLANHTANIPGQAFNEFVNQNNAALTEFPFWRSSAFHWGIRGSGNRWEVDDSAGNTQSTIHRVWVRGDLSPIGTLEVTRNLGASGGFSMTPADFGVSFTDNCSAVSQSLSQTEFTCADIGVNTIQLTGIDEAGNSTAVDLTVTVEETPPVINVPSGGPFTSIELDSNGQVTVDLETLNTTVSDDCGIDTVVISETEFTCETSGFVPLTITATDVNGNVTTANVLVIIDDPIAPVVTCVAPFSIELDATGTARIEARDLLASFTDNCGLGGVTADQSVFTCADIGDNVVTLTVEDTFGNEATCSTTVTVTLPTCPGDLMLQTEGNACGVTYNYPCASNLTEGPASGTFLAEGTTTTFVYDIPDNNGGTSSCSYTVTVADTEGPMFTGQSQTLTLDASGMGTLTATDLLGADPLANDYTIDRTGTLDRVDISATGTVVALDDDEISNPLPLGFSFGFYGTLYTDFYISSNGFIAFSDNDQEDGCCSGQFLPNADLPNNLIAFDWNDINPEDGGTIRYETIGTAPNRILIMDWNRVTHIDDINNVTTVQVKLLETSNRIELHITNIPETEDNKTQGLENADGTAAIVVPGRNATQWSAANEVVAFIPVSGILDGCGVDTLVASQTDFDCSHLGENTVTLTATDVNGNVSVQNAIVTVLASDTAAPVITLVGEATIELEQGADYIELGATTNDGTEVVIDAGALDTRVVGSYSVTYNAVDLPCNAAIEVIRTVNVLPLLALEGNPFAKAIAVYPNPTQSVLYIESSEHLMETIEVTDMSGRLIKRIQQDAIRNYELNMSDLAGSVYFVKISSGDRYAIKRIIKN